MKKRILETLQMAGGIFIIVMIVKYLLGLEMFSVRGIVVGVLAITIGYFVGYGDGQRSEKKEK